MSEYKKPDRIHDDMGGVDGKYSVAMVEINKLLKSAPQVSGKILDVGLGKGQISEMFQEWGGEVTAIGLEIDSYGADINDLRDKGITIVESNVEEMPFENEVFDVVVASHILEHVGNMSMALKEIRRVLKKDGWLYIFIPPYNSGVISGHINTGWNIGQLMYVLLLNGFDVKDGHFIKGNYSICSYTKKTEQKLPVLRYDYGDIDLLNSANLFPVPVKEKNGISDRFFGDILALNWENADEFLNDYKSIKSGKRLVKSIAKVTHKMLGDYNFKKICEVFDDESNTELINPSVLE